MRTFGYWLGAVLTIAIGLCVTEGVVFRRHIRYHAEIEPQFDQRREALALAQQRLEILSRSLAENPSAVAPDEALRAARKIALVAAAPPPSAVSLEALREIQRRILLEEAELQKNDQAQFKNAARQLLAVNALNFSFLVVLLVLTLVALKAFSRKAKAEALARAEERKYRAFFERSLDPTALMIGNIFVDCNQALLAELGFRDKRQFIGKTPVDISPEFQPDGQPSATKAALMIAEVIERGGIRFEWTHERVDGSLIPVDVSLTATPMLTGTLIFASWKNLSVRKAAEAERDRLAALVMTTTDLIVSFSPTGQIVFLNRAMRRGLSLPETAALPDRNIADFLPETEKRRLRETILPVAAEKGDWKGDVQLLGAIGRAILCSVVVIAKRDTDSSLSLFTLIARDISDRLAIEKALRESNSRFQNLFDNTPAIIYMKDTHGRYIRINRHYERLLGGIRSDQVVGLTDLTLFGEKTAIPLMKNDREVLEIGRVLSVDEVVDNPDGKHRFLSVKFPLRDDDNKIYALGGVSIDITERTLVEEEVHRVRMLLSNIIDFMPSALIAVDEQRRVTTVNQIAKRLSGKDEKEILGHPVDNVFPVFANQFAKLSETFERQQSHVIDHFACDIDAQAKVFSLKFYPLGDNANARGAVILADDITDKTRFEEILIQTEKMMSVGGLAAGMAHEINNPLGIILQSVDNLARRLTARLSANIACAETVGLDFDALQRYLDARRVDAFLQDIREAGRRSADIVKSMLRFSRGGENRSSLVKVRELVREAVELAANDYDLKKKYDFRHIDIQSEIAENLPPIFCVETEIKQVLLNLLKNAAQAMREKAYGENEKPRVRIRAFLESSTWFRLDVEDNGPGMVPAIMKRVFEPFFTTKPVGIGTGLGLSVSYFIVTENHRGVMEVSSSPGKGAVFTIKLPIPGGQAT